MSYVEQTLASDERVVHRANFNWTYSFFPTLWFAIGCGAVGFVAGLQFWGGLPAAKLGVAWWSAWTGAAAGALIAGTHIVHLITTEIVVTSYRFVYKRGLISRNTQEVSLNNIEEITLTQSVWGRLFGYGRLVMRGTGVGVIELPNLDNPIEVRKVIENARSSLRRSRGDSSLDMD